MVCYGEYIHRPVWIIEEMEYPENGLWKPSGDNVYNYKFVKSELLFTNFGFLAISDNRLTKKRATIAYNCINIAILLLKARVQPIFANELRDVNRNLIENSISVNSVTFLNTIRSVYYYDLKYQKDYHEYRKILISDNELNKTIKLAKKIYMLKKKPRDMILRTYYSYGVSQNEDYLSSFLISTINIELYTKTFLLNEYSEKHSLSNTKKKELLKQGIRRISKALYDDKLVSYSYFQGISKYWKYRNLYVHHGKEPPIQIQKGCRNFVEKEIFWGLLKKENIKYSKYSL